jgi:membrane protease YdiL (CAAX protease family)
MEVFLTYVVLSLAIASLWMGERVNKYKSVSIFLFLVAFASGVFFKKVEYYTFIFVIIMLFISWKYSANLKFKLLAGIVFLVVSALCMFHLVPGFHNLNIVNQFQLENDSIPYTLYLNFDKALVGFTFLFFFKDLIKSRADFLPTIKPTLLIAAGTIGSVLVLSYLMGFIHISVKTPWFIGYFLIANLFFTCIPEEIIFRKLIQSSLKENLANVKNGHILSVGISSLLFGLMHFPGGVKYMLLATVAGLGYGWAFEKTGRIESSVAIHYGLNVIHILFFTYPALSGAI